MSSTACQFLSEVLPGWPDRGAEHTQWTGMPSLSGGIKADLIAAGIECAESLWGQSGIAPGFQQAKSDILERTNALGKSLAKQTCAGYLAHPSVFWGFKQKFLPIFTSPQTFSIH